jgi:hypothetical protein
MDLIKELEKLKNGNISHQSLVDQLEQEKEDLEKKKYMVALLHTAKQVEEYVNLRNFATLNIKGFLLECYIDEDFYHSIRIHFYRPDGEIIHPSSMRKEYPGLTARLDEILHGGDPKYWLVKTEYLNEDFIEKRSHDIDLAKGAGEKVLDALLNKELKNILDYSRMQVDLPTNELNSKKLKM